MYRKLILGISLLLAPACADNAPAQDDRKIVSLSAATETCESTLELCTASEPPVCSSYCADETEPGDDGCVIDSDDNVTCDEQPCVVLLDSDGNEIVSCPGDDCVVSYDAETMTETIECGLGGDDCPNQDEDGGCSEPGNPGDDGGGSDPGDDGDEDPACPNGPDGSEECPIPL